MAIYNVHAGHCPQGQGASGAVGFLQESVEDRKVKNRVISALRSSGHTAYDCTDDTNCSVNQNLQRIVAKCNAHSVNLDISIHLNAGGGTGVEVWCYDGKTTGIANAICRNISNTLGISNRGVKYSQGLYVLRKTSSPALLVECCFVDNQTDYNHWNADKCGDAIASAICGKSVQGSDSTVESIPNTVSGLQDCLGNGDRGSDVSELQTMLISCGYSCGSYGADGVFGASTEAAVKAFQRANGLKVDGLAGVKTMSKLRSLYSGKSTVSTTTGKDNWTARLQNECNVQGFSNQVVDGIPGKNTLAGCPTMKQGASGNITRLLQEKLIALGYSCGSYGADGKFGSGTRSAVIVFQNAHGLSADGIVGQNTWRALLGL